MKGVLHLVGLGGGRLVSGSGVPPCRMSNLRNDNVACLCHAKTPMSLVKFLKLFFDSG